MANEIKQCSECGNKRVIVNKKYNLCVICNKIRLEALKSKDKEKIDEQSSKKEPIRKQKVQKRLKQISEKEKANKKEYYEILAQKFDSQSEFYCRGCGTRQNLTPSHYLPRSLFKRLESDPKNITLHCIQREDGSLGCHQRIESLDWELMTSLQDWEQAIEYYKGIDYLPNEIDYYELVLSKGYKKEVEEDTIPNKHGEYDSDENLVKTYLSATSEFDLGLFNITHLEDIYFEESYKQNEKIYELLLVRGGAKSVTLEFNSESKRKTIYNELMMRVNKYSNIVKI